MQSTLSMPPALHIMAQRSPLPFLQKRRIQILANSPEICLMAAHMDSHTKKSSILLPCPPVVSPTVAFMLSLISSSTLWAEVCPGCWTQMAGEEGPVSPMARKWVLADTGMETTEAESCFWWAVRKDGWVKEEQTGTKFTWFGCI